MFLLSIHAHCRSAGGSVLHHVYTRTQVAAVTSDNIAVTMWDRRASRKVASSRCAHLKVTHITLPHKSLARCGSKANSAILPCAQEGG